MVRTWIAKAVGISGRALPHELRLLASLASHLAAFDEKNRCH